jgi:cysteinyl-tRNA synthetase
MALPLDEVDIALPLSEVRSWAYQIQEVHLNSSIEALAQTRYDLVVIEPSRTDWSPAEAGQVAAADFDTANAVAQLKRSRASDGFHRKLVFAYIDIGQAEDWRWYWTWTERAPADEEAAALCAGPFPPPPWPDYIVKCDPDKWLHNYPVRFWDPAWQNVVMQGNGLSSAPHPYISIIDEVLRDGFDGIYLDWVEAFEDGDIRRLAEAEGVSPAEAMVGFLQAMRLYGRARNPQFLVIQQNAASLISESQDATRYIDALAQEAVWFDGEATDDWSDPAGYDQANEQSLVNYYLSQLDLYQKAGLPVFVCEYALNQAPTAYQNALNKGFIPYVTRRSLSRLTTTPSPLLPAPRTPGRNP